MTTSGTAPLSSFDPARTAFGRHETFALRYGWLPKGFQALDENQKCFESDDCTIVLGVGRNMVKSIRFWLRATRIAKPTTEGFEPTPIGRAIFSENGWDPYLEDEGTIWLLHWLLATNPSQATTWYWFFNLFHKPEFSSQELTSALHNFVKDDTDSSVSFNTLKTDVAVLLRMYSQSKGLGRMPLEEALDSPLSLLRLVSQMSGGKRYISHPESREGLPTGILGFAVAKLFEARSATEMPIEELMYGYRRYPAIGSIFRLTENALLTGLERFVNYLPNVFELRETAGIHQIYKLEEIKSERYLEKHYSPTSSAEEMAA